MFVNWLDCSQSFIFPQDHRDRALCVTGCHLAWVSKLLRGRGRFGRKREKWRDCNNIIAARVQEVWQEFHAFYHSLIKKLRWWWKTCQTHLASIRHVYKYLLPKRWFYNVSGPFLEIKSANMNKKTFSLSKYQTFLVCLRKMCLMVWQTCLTNLITMFFVE